MVANALYHSSVPHSHLFVLQQFEFTKAPLPTFKEDKIEFSKKLLKYNITLAQYESTLTLSHTLTCV